jgi:putative ABC transport system substrate-binding protein
MDRRAFVAGAAALLAAPLPAGAQAGRTYRIAYLSPGPRSCPATHASLAFRQGLADAGYIEGRDVIVDRRCFPTGQMAAGVLNDLLKTKPDILVAASDPSAVAIRDAALAIPVVFVNVADPIGSRMVQSLARPGGNMTGLADLTLDLNAKRVQLLREMLPDVRLVATLSNPDEPGTTSFRAEVDRAAPGLGLRIKHFMATKAEDLPAVFESIRKDGMGAVVVMQSPLFWTERAQIARLGAQQRLPSMYALRALVEAGGLIGYGAEQGALYRRAAGYVVKILKGAKPGDLPVEQPTQFELVVNLKTAKALGLTIPPSLLARADQVIE